jgi:putative exosortase-associated protein (TIGR04073 family)
MPLPAIIFATGDTAMKSWILIVLSTLLCFSALSIASDEAPSEKPLLTKPFMKLGRGVVNMISAPFEVPNQMYILSDHADENSRYGVETAAGAIEGLFTGSGIALWRFVVGAYDFLTFPLPVYEAGLIDPPYITVSYEAYYERPESAVMIEDDDLSPVLSDETDGTSPSGTGEKDTTTPSSSGAEDAAPAPDAEVK